MNLHHGFRIKPLGYDRNYNRYWFFRGYPGVFVEQGMHIKLSYTDIYFSLHRLGWSKYKLFR